MMVIVAEALQAVGQSPSQEAGHGLDQFVDAGQLAPYASESATSLVKADSTRL